MLISYVVIDMFICGVTDKGSIRAVNQDGIFLNGFVGIGIHSEIKAESSYPALIYVADGVGGAQDGAAAVNAMMAYSRSHPYPSSHAELRDYLFSMNSYVCQCAADAFVDTASTIAGVLVTKNETLSFNIGDSKVYNVNNGYLQQVSTDDTVFGLIKEEPDSTKAIKPPLLQYIGKSNLETNCHIKALSKVKELMICSDGLTDLVETDDIEEILEKYTVPMEMVHMLYNKAMENGGYDNISIVYIQLENDK